MKSAHTTPTGKLLAAMLVAAGTPAIASAQFLLTGTSYIQNFDGIGAGLPTGWDVRLSATSSALGTTASPILTPSATTDWSNTGAGFKNYASSTGLTSAEVSATQQAATDRALGVRQTGTTGYDPGAAFSFNFNANGKIFSGLSIDLEMLRVETRSTTWSLQYGLGAAPTSFTTLGTFTDPGAFGSTTRTFVTGDLSGMNNQANVWFRVVALTGSSGSGSRDSFAIDNFSLTYSAAGADISIGGGSSFSASSFGGASFTSIDIAVFDGSSQTVTLDGAVTTGGLKFVTNGYTLASGVSDSVAVTGAVEVATGISAEISGKITGSNTLTKTGEGTLVVSNISNDFVGNVAVNAGTLQVASDAVLGNADNNVRLGGGVFQPTQTIALAAGRDLTGSGAVKIASGQTLTLNGVLAAEALTLSDSGTLGLGGVGNTATSLNFSAPGSVTGNAVTVSGIASSAFVGEATVASNVTFDSAADRTISAVGDIELSGSVTLGSSARRLIKTGTGNLTLSGDQSGNLGGIRLGVQGTTPSDGGTLTVNANNALGATTFQFNSGTLTSTTERSFANPLSIGGRNNGVTASTLSGANMTFTGNGNGFFGATGTTGQFALDVNNQTTVSGSWIASTGAASTGIDLGGFGSLVLTGDASLVTQTWTLQDSVTFLVTSALGGGVIVSDGTTFGGGGTVTSLSLQEGATLVFAFDPLQVDTITAASFGSTLGGSGLIELDFGGTALEGTFDLVTSASAITAFSANQFSIVNLGAGYTGTVGLTANALQITVSAIPEPSAFAALAGLAALGGAITRRRRRAV